MEGAEAPTTGGRTDATDQRVLDAGQVVESAGVQAVVFAELRAPDRYRLLEHGLCSLELPLRQSDARDARDVGGS